MQTKPLIHCADAKGIMIKLMLCVVAVLSLTMFIPQEVEAGPCHDCTCDPGAPGRSPYSGDEDYNWACSNNGKCEVYCGGHRYDKGPGKDNGWDAGWDWTYDEPLDYYHDEDSFFCSHWRYHRIRLHYKCSICGQIIGWDIDVKEEWHEPVLETVLFRNPKDPCQVMWMSSCKFCKKIEDGGFFGWSHIEYKPDQVFNDNPFLVPTTNETGEANNIWMMDCDGCGGSAVTAQALTNVNNEEAHAIWCGHHWYVNHENCDDSVKNKLNLGEYIGDYFYGTPGNPSGQRQDGLLHMYGHELVLGDDNKTLECSICGHKRPIGSMTLLSKRTDNDAIIGYSDFRKGVPPTAAQAPWTNSNVTFDHNAPGGVSTSHNIWDWKKWGLMLDGNDRGSGRTTLSQEGTHIVYTNEGYHHREERYVRVGTGHYTDSEGKRHSYAIYGWRWFDCCNPYGNSGHPAPGKAQAAPHYVKIDKTAPKTTPTVTTGAYKTPISKLENEDGTFNSEAYGMKINLGADDSNPKARGGKTDVAGIFVAYVEVIPVDGDGRQVTNLQRTYDLGQNRNGGVVTADQGVSWLPNHNGKGVLTINTTNVIDVNKDFPEYLDFHYKIHVIDCAGNDAVTEGDIVRQPEVFTNITNISNNKELRKTNSFIGGEHGVLRIITTGYVDDSTLDWNEFTLGASECDRSHEYPTMVYNQILQMKPYTTETSGFRLAKDGEYYPLLEPMASYTPDGGYTRIYEFVFWTPFNHGWQNEDGSMPYKSPTDQYSVKTVGWNKRYNRVGNAKTYYKIGADKITDKFRTSLVF